MFVVKLCVALCVLLCCEYALGNTLWKIEDVDVNDDIVQHALKTAITQISVGEKAEMKKDFFKKLKAVSAKRRVSSPWIWIIFHFVFYITYYVF